MLRIMKTLAAAFAVLALSNFLCATPPGPGFQHIQFTGIEEILGPPVQDEDLPLGWMVFTTKKTLSIPSLQIDELVLYVEYTYFEDALDDGFFGAFRMHGVGTIMDVDELGGPGVPIGDTSFANLGMYDETRIAEGLLDFVADGTGGGAYWAGPFIGMAMIEKATIDARLNIFTGDAGWYSSKQVGFLLVPDTVDMKKLRASLRE